MRFLRLTLDPQFFAPSPEATSGEVHNIQYLSDGTILELYEIEGDIETVLGSMETNPETMYVEHLGTANGRHFVFHCGRPSEEIEALIGLLVEYRAMVMLPLRFDDQSGVTVDIIGAGDSLHELYRRFPADIRRHTTIEQVGDYIPGQHGLLSELTERQREALAAAVEVGYYATPRTATAEDVAEVIGGASSTASEHLRKLEARVFRSLLE